ncbi:cache domain-containing sensor histidine kinase [Paenibacillus sp. strain BS8-2]
MASHEFLARIIRQIRLWIRRLGLPKRWLVAYLCLIVLPSTLILYAYYEHSTSVLEEEVSDSMLQTMKQAGINLSYRFGNVEEIVNTLTMNKELYEFLENDNSAPVIDRLEEVEEIRKLVRNIQLNNDVFRLRLFVDSNNLLANEHINFFSLEGLKDWRYYQEVLDSQGGLVWTGIYKQSYIDLGEKSVFSLARFLHNPRQFNQVAAILILDVSEKLVLDILSEIELTEHKEVFLVNPEGEVTAHTDRSQVGNQLSDNMLEVISQGTEGKAKLKLNGHVEYLVYATIEPKGWKIVAQVPASDITTKVKLNQGVGIATLVAFLLLFLILVLVLLTVIVRQMNRRILDVIHVIRKEGIDRFGEHPIPDIGLMQLDRSVEVLVHRVHMLMEQTYEAQVQERGAQLRALQAQINPHFLYNTLDTINWMAIGHNMKDISFMIDSLSQYFRLSLNKGQDTMSVKDELHLAQVYLDIQMNRFANTFDYRIEPDPEVLAYIIPKLTLQPLVENALLHGIRKVKNKHGLIIIRAFQEDDYLVLTVSDDGIGIEEEKARALLLEPNVSFQENGGGSSYGLYNVNERIRLFGGNASGLRIQSKLGEGTTVWIRVKYTPPTDKSLR